MSAVVVRAKRSAAHTERRKAMLCEVLSTRCLRGFVRSRSGSQTSKSRIRSPMASQRRVALGVVEDSVEHGYSRSIGQVETRTGTIPKTHATVVVEDVEEEVQSTAHIDLHALSSSSLGCSIRDGSRPGNVGGGAFAVIAGTG
jgi:hypothetical protein